MRVDAAPEGLRQSMAWLHSWAGLLLGWLLFAIFLSGSLAFFKQELNLWSRPELLSLDPAPVTMTPAALARAEARLHALAPAAQSWRLSWPDERRPAALLSWREPAPAEAKAKAARPRFEQRWLDPATAEPLAVRASFGAGEFLYRFHFELRSAVQSRWILEGRWLVGLAGLVMLVALLSGIVTHRRLFKDFFLFRPRAKAAQRAWLDAHNLCGVLVLPFLLTITFSGLMTLHSLYLPAGIAAAYGRDSAAYFAELDGDAAAERRGRPAAAPAPLPLLGEAGWTRLLAQAQREWPGARIDSLALQRGADGRPQLELNRHEGERLQYRAPLLRLDALSGERLQLLDTAAPAARVYGVLYGLHMARFADWPLRWTLFGFGLLGTALMATGLLLWSIKRRAEAQRRGLVPGRGQRLVERLNLATIAGLPLAMAGLLWASRLLPLELAARPDAELRSFYAVWGLSLLAAALGCGWRGLWSAGALAFCGLGLLAGFEAFSARAQLSLLQAGFAPAFLSTGLLLAGLAWHCHRRQGSAAAAPAPATAPVQPGPALLRAGR